MVGWYGAVQKCGSVTVGYVFFFFALNISHSSLLVLVASPDLNSIKLAIQTASLCSTLALLPFSFSAICLSTPAELIGYVDACAARRDAMSERIVDVRPKKNVNQGMMAVRRTVWRRNETR